MILEEADRILAKERAERGIAFLDKEEPLWFMDVRPIDLEMNSVCKCVLGQMGARRIEADPERGPQGNGYHRYIQMLIKFLPHSMDVGTPDEESDDTLHGFDYPHGMSKAYKEQIQESWLEAIVERQARALQAASIATSPASEGVQAGLDSPQSGDAGDNS